jgi:hypothetical protein
LCCFVCVCVCERSIRSSLSFLLLPSSPPLIHSTPRPPAPQATDGQGLIAHINMHSQELAFNPKYQDLYAPSAGPQPRGFASAGSVQPIKRNTWTGEATLCMHAAQQDGGEEGAKEARTTL